MDCHSHRCACALVYRLTNSKTIDTRIDAADDSTAEKFLAIESYILLVLSTIRNDTIDASTWHHRHMDSHDAGGKLDCDVIDSQNITFKL